MSSDTPTPSPSARDVATSLMGVRVLVYPEGDVFIVQGVDVDICAHDDTPGGAMVAFLRALQGEIVLALENGENTVQAPPPQFMQRYEAATRAPVSGAEREAGRVEAARAIMAWVRAEFRYDGPLTDDGVAGGIELGAWRRFLPGAKEGT